MHYKQVPILKIDCFLLVYAMAYPADLLQNALRHFMYNGI